METFPQIVTLVVLIPAIGAFINLFWGARMGERAAGIVGSTAAALAFFVALLLFFYLGSNHGEPAVVNPPLLDGWLRIPSIGLEIGWQQRVDSLSVAMMLVVTGVGTLIHVYAIGYMHGDERFARFFVFMNMFLVFMLILVTGNNFLMMFVGWEGVGLCSYLLIGFWWDKAKGVGWRNSNAARKAFIVNRIGDFGLLMGLFLMFFTFGTLDFYKPGEVVNVDLARELAEEEAAHSEEAAPAESETHSEEPAAAAEGETHTEGEATAAEGEHGEEAAIARPTDNEALSLSQLGVFGQAERLLALNEGETLAEPYAYNGRVFVDENGAQIQRGRTVYFGPFALDIQTMIELITLFMLIGAMGKSAQIPLFVWLPDAMAGPTPVSALIHAATMVTAGVYMMVRSNVLYYNADLTSFIVAMTGATTAIMAGFIAMGQWDIKRVLAYSTISQLGFMVAAVGIGAYVAAMFHLITHAVFKALLFLGSGSVIHGMEHGHHHTGHHGHDQHHADEEEFDPQDMRNMGGLRRKMPVTFWTYIIGTLALAGIFPFAGFWSKDEILADAWLVGLEKGDIKGYLVLGILLGAAAFTAFYMWRQLEMVFFGKPRTEAAEHASESGSLMTVPLIVLAIGAVLMGFINIPSGAGILAFGLDGVYGVHQLGHLLESSISTGSIPDFQLAIALGALTLGLGGIFLARSIYGGGKALTSNRKDPLQVNPNFGLIWLLSHHRLYVDELYHRLFVAPFQRTGRFLADMVDQAFWHDYFHNTVVRDGFNAISRLLGKPVDLGIIDGAVNGIGSVVRRVSGLMRRVQTGYVRTYAVGVLLGVVLVLLILLLPLLQNGG